MTSVHHDLVVRNGTLIVPGVGRLDADVGIVGDRITTLGRDLTGVEVYDAAGKVVLPGIFDPHVHIGNELSFDAEAESETRAAILGGVTTIGIFIRSLEDSYLVHLPALRAAMDEKSYVDSIFHPQIFTEQQIDEMPLYTRDYGIRSFKFYMSGIPGIVKSVSDDVLLRGFRQIAAIGDDVIACVHCETGALIERARKDLEAQKPQGTLADWEAAHPAMAEALAIRTASYLAKVAGVHLYVVHVSSRDGIEAVRMARADGTRLTAETITPFLGISSDDPNGFLAKMVPPVRTPEHRAALWEAVRDGTLDTVGTDNTSRRRASKRPEAGLHGARPGHASLGTHLPVLLHHGREHGIELERLIDLATRKPAQTYGLYPRKGTIAPGSDADLVIVDLDREKVVVPADLRGMSDCSPFEGKILRGWPLATIKGGRIVACDGEIVAPASGRYLPRPLASLGTGAAKSRATMSG
jgi:dihydroorotase-like cyclic amidohydrolase